MSFNYIFRKDGPLFQVRRFVSPVYAAQLEREIAEDVDRPGRVEYKDVRQDNIINWLNDNALYCAENPFPKESRGDLGYFFSANGGSLIIVPEFRDAKPEERDLFQEKDRFFQRLLTMRIQPRLLDIPSEIYAALGERNYKEVENF